MSSPSAPRVPNPPVPAEPHSGKVTAVGRFLVLTAALLGWMFDGLEMGLFPLVAKPALTELLTAGLSPGEATPADLGSRVSAWIGIINASFLVGAATGGVLFGWLGDRIGRVRAMTFSVLVYALFTGACGLSTDVWHIAGLRFVASLGMGGEWALGVSLVMEVWQVKSRGLLAGLIGAAANVGYLIVGFVGLGLAAVSQSLGQMLLSFGVSEQVIRTLLAHDGWRLMMLLGSTPALLTLLIRFFVPESESWEREKEQGRTSQWATKDLLGVLIGAFGPLGIIWLWSPATKAADGTPTAGLPVLVLLVGTLAGLLVALVGYLYPVLRYLGRTLKSDAAGRTAYRQTVGRMLLGAGLAGVALLGTWGTTQNLPTHAANLVKEALKEREDLARKNLPVPADVLPTENAARSWTQISSAAGAILGTLIGALMGDYFGRRLTYSLLCAAGMASVLVVFNIHVGYGATFLALTFLAGCCSASFYGWLPLYLPELFPARMRATGQGFAFNFGRIFAAVGVLQLGPLHALLGGLPLACSVLTGIYLLGIPLILFAPETHGKPLPE